MKKILTSPYDLVANILEIEPELLNEKSGIGVTPNWDSLKHIEIIGELEDSYDIAIPNDKIENYMTMNSIIQLYKEKSGNFNFRNRINEFLKKNIIGKIFKKRVSLSLL